MIFRSPFAWIGLVALVVPIVIHLLVRAPAQPIVLASLRFVPTSPMRALRRRLLNDGGLLALRLAALALAVAAFADPLFTPACRRATWNGRLVRAVVADPRVDAATIERARREPAPFASTVISSASLASGLARALVWLDDAPAARREVVFLAPLTLGSIDEAAVRTAPASIGVRFVRSGASTSMAKTVAPRLTTADDHLRLLARTPEVTFASERMVTTPGAASPLPGETIERTTHGWRASALGIEIVGAETARPDLRAGLMAALAVGVPFPASNAARPIVLIADDGAIDAFAPPVARISAAWMAETLDALSNDAALARELRGTTVVVDAPLPEPWRTALRDANGRVLAALARTEGNALAIRVRSSTASPALAAIARSALVAGSDTQALSRADTLPIPDASLTAWTRPAGELDERDAGTPKESDRRWFWVAALAALGAETFLRRREKATSMGESGSHERAA